MHLGTALDIMSSGADTRDPGLVSPSAYMFSSSHRDESEETADQRNEGTMGKKFGFSFSCAGTRRLHGQAKDVQGHRVLLILP